MSFTEAMNLILVFFVCLFNIYGLIFYMSDVRKISDILKGMSLKAKIYSVLAITLVAVSVMEIGVCLFTFITLEYLGLLLWYRKEKKECLKPALRGIVCIIVSILTELSIISVYYYCNIENLEYTGKITSEIKMASYLGMALMQCFLIIMREIKKMKKGYRMVLMATLASKNLLDFIWLFACISTKAFKYSHILFPFLFILELQINYHSFCIMIQRLEEKAEQDKRADINVNAYEYYLNMEEEHLRIRKMYHEMKNQLMIMKDGDALWNDEQIKYRNSFQEKLEKMNQFYHTGVSTLDILLFDGRKKAEARNIEFEAVIEDGCLNFIEKEDLNIIFGNAIINAIEACEKIKNGPKQITIKAGKNVDDILIYVKNTVSIDREKGSLSTKKKNRIKHGIGLTSIQECVEKYNGYVSIIEEDGTFQLAILFGKG